MSTEILKIKDGAAALTGQLNDLKKLKLSAYVNSSQAEFTSAIQAHTDAHSAQSAANAEDLTAYNEEFATAEAQMVAMKEFIVQNTDDEALDSIFEIQNLVENQTSQLTSQYIAFGEEMDVELAALQSTIGTSASVKEALDAVLPENWYEGAGSEAVEAGDNSTSA